MALVGQDPSAGFRSAGSFFEALVAQGGGYDFSWQRSPSSQNPSRLASLASLRSPPNRVLPSETYTRCTMRIPS